MKFNKIGLIGAMKEEIRIIKENLVDLESFDIAQFTFFQGRLGSQKVVLVESGIGKVNAALSVALLVHHFEVDFVINTGSAGAADPGLKVGDIVIARSIVHHDVDVTGFGYKKGQMAGMPEEYFPHLEAITLAKKVCRLLGIEPVLGQIASGDQFVNDAAHVKNIRRDFPTVRAVEMESAAIAQAAYVLEVPCLIIRSISDAADSEAAITFDEFIILAAANSAQLVMSFIAALEN